ncbi:TetR family transcriptional regulator [Amylibacter marinus]|uniref:TetR family transcriptional regulator n=1 Tax=Amylibacter marinus TaxID=1475483 RepID=A0ABQ5VX11_9RHOB|nr:TetR/AcrR family transcriptional regulator [Amylibacter marinus]GLQ35844.1 TetR family transcriptional regulator [Amylibacter marinus]
MNIREERRRVLREKLIDIAEAKIAADGLASVSARYLSGEAGCALGAIYNIFDDLNELFLAVNLRGFQRMAEYVQGAVDVHAGGCEQLNVMGQAYLQYALDNTQSWRALFEVDLPEGQDIPEYYQASLLGLLSFIKDPVRLIYPCRADEEIALIANTIFSSIHGIVQLGVQRRVSVLDQEHLVQMISFITFQLRDAA